MATRELTTSVRSGAPAAAIIAGNVVLVALLMVVRGPVPVLLALLVAAPIIGIGAYALVQRPQRGVLLLAALVPFHGLGLIIPFPGAWKEGLIAATLAATFLAPAEARGGRRRLPNWVPVVAAFVLLGTVSSLFVSPLQAATGLKVTFFSILVALIVWRCPLDERERDRLVTILMVVGFVTAVVGLAQQVVGDVALNNLGYEYNRTIRFSGGFLRSYSTFSLNFPFALFLTLVMLLGIPLALEEPKRRRSQLFLAGLPVLLLAQLFTLTRAGWLGLAAGLIYLAITRIRSLAVAFAHAAAIALIALLLAGAFGSALLSSSSSEERFDQWADHVSEIAANPLGAGIGSTGSAGAKAVELAGGDPEGVFQPDNYYFKITFELGVVGLWLLGLLFATTLSSTHGAAKRLSGRDGALAAGVTASIVAAIVVSVVATYFEIFPMDVYFWMLLAIVATCVHESR